MSDKPVGAESQPIIHYSMVEDDGSALCWEGDCCPDTPPIISTEIREVTCPECIQHYGILNDLAKVVGAESGAQPERDQVAREVAERLGWKINGGGLVEFADGQGGRTSPYPSEAKLLWEALLDKELECRRLREALEKIDDMKPFDKLPQDQLKHVEHWLRSNEKKASDVKWSLYPIGMVGRWIERAEALENQHAKTNIDGPGRAEGGRMRG